MADGGDGLRSPQMADDMQTFAVGDYERAPDNISEICDASYKRDHGNRGRV